MSKRVEVRMPGDRTAAVQAFVDQGKEDEAPAPPKTAPGGKAARLNVDLSPDLHRRFKTACAAEGTKMVDVVAQLIEGWISEKR